MPVKIGNAVKKAKSFKPQSTRVEEKKNLKANGLPKHVASMNSPKIGSHKEGLH